LLQCGGISLEMLRRSMHIPLRTEIHGAAAPERQKKEYTDG